MALRAPPANPLTTLFARLVVAVVVAARARNVVPTSWFRTPAENAALGGVPGSLHLQGIAIDLAGDSDELGQIEGIWRAIGLDAVDEGDHLHLELQARAR